MEVKTIFWRKKRQPEKERLLDMEETYDKKEEPNFYNRSREIKREFQPQTSFCKDKY